MNTAHGDLLQSKVEKVGVQSLDDTEETRKETTNDITGVFETRGSILAHH